jgi:hypothetical protein
MHWQYPTPSEAIFVREKQIEILRGIDNLTLTFDGNTTRKPHSIYTVHATISKLWEFPAIVRK